MNDLTEQDMLDDQKAWEEREDLHARLALRHKLITAALIAIAIAALLSKLGVHA